MKFYYTEFTNDLQYYDYVPNIWEPKNEFVYYRINHKQHDTEFVKNASYDILNKSNEIPLKYNFLILEIKED